MELQQIQLTVKTNLVFCRNLLSRKFTKNCEQYSTQGSRLANKKIKNFHVTLPLRIIAAYCHDNCTIRMCTATKELLHRLSIWKAVMKMNANGWLSVSQNSNCPCSLLCELSIQRFFCSYPGVISSVLHTLAIVQTITNAEECYVLLLGQGENPDT